MGRPSRLGVDHLAGVRFGPSAIYAGKRPDPRGAASIHVHIGLAALLLGVVALGAAGVGFARLIFVLGCLVISHQAYRRGGLPLHGKIAICLFVFAPLVRRIIDLRCGYDEASTVLIGPLIGLVVVIGELRSLLSPRTPSIGTLTPYLLMTICIGYAWALSSFEGNLLQSTAIAATYMAPLLYCVCVILRPDQSRELLLETANTFLLLSPMIALYGIIQYLDPPVWDVFWMKSSKMTSIGYPVAQQVRVFSTMNSPVIFAAYATCGLLLFNFMPRSFLPPVLVPFVAILPCCLVILLTSVRTAWISAIISIVFCMFFSRTRARALLLAFSVAAAITIALAVGSLANVVSDRLTSLNNNVEKDGSGNARLSDLRHVYLEDPHFLVGLGMAPSDPDPVLVAADGLILSSGIKMGIIAGPFYVMCALWAGIQALFRIRRGDEPIRLIAGAVILGNLAITPLTTVVIGPIGFLFWMLVGALTSNNTGFSRRTLPS